jgi:hypothetical protein
VARHCAVLHTVPTMSLLAADNMNDTAESGGEWIDGPSISGTHTDSELDVGSSQRKVPHVALVVLVLGLVSGRFPWWRWGLAGRTLFMAKLAMGRR